LDSSQILNEDLVDADDNAIVDEAGLSVIGVDLLQKVAPTATTNTTNAHQTYATRNSGQGPYLSIGCWRKVQWNPD
jgi:hypothetical protein